MYVCTLLEAACPHVEAGAPQGPIFCPWLTGEYYVDVAEGGGLRKLK